MISPDWIEFAGMADTGAVRHTADGAGCYLSLDGRYRYLLWRAWDDRPPLGVCLLNPSRADHQVQDLTVHKLGVWARKWGHGGYVLVNAFGLRTPYPNQLHRDSDPVGPDNDMAVLEAARTASRVMVGWGTPGSHPDLRERMQAVEAALRWAHPELYCLSVNRDGSPIHPVRQSYALDLRAYPHRSI